MPFSNSLPAVRLRTWRLGVLSAGPVAMEPICKLCGIQAAAQKPSCSPCSRKLQAAKKTSSWPVPANCINMLQRPGFWDNGFYLAPFQLRGKFRCAIAWRVCEAAGPTVPAFVLCGLCAIVKTGRCAGQSYLDLQLRHLHDMDPAGQACRCPC